MPFRNSENLESPSLLYKETSMKLTRMGLPNREKVLRSVG